jgi:hypothetical protein
MASATNRVRFAYDGAARHASAPAPVTMPQRNSPHSFCGQAIHAGPSE